MLYTGRNDEGTSGHAPKVQNEHNEVIASGGHWFLYILICILTLGLFAITQITVKNKLNQLEMKINNAASNVDIQLEKRFDTLSKLVDTAKSHCKFSKETFENIAAYRSGVKRDINSVGINDKSNLLIDKNNIVENINRNFNMAFENYPILGADESIRTLRNEIVLIERELAATRRAYNSLVTLYNKDIYNFYIDVIISKKGYRGIPLFKTEEYKRADVNSSFF